MNKIDKLIMEECPDGVPYCEIRDIGNVSMCKRIMKNQTSDIGDIPFYKIGTFGKDADAYISNQLYEEYRSRFSYPKKGDVLLSASGTIGRAIIFDGKPAYFQDSNIVWVENDESKVLNKFLFYLYQIANWDIKGGTIKRLYNENILKLKIPVPPLKVQEKIVNILDKFGELEVELEAELEARKKQYEFWSEKIFQKYMAGLTKQITDIALVKARVGWQRLTRSEYLNSGDYYLITGTDFTEEGKIDFNTCVYITKERYDMDENIQIHKNDILITKDGTLGKVAFLNEEPPKLTTLNSGIFRINLLVNDVLPKYIYHYLNSKIFKDFIDSVKTGSTIPHLTQEKLVNLNIPIPSIKEQEKVIKILDKFESLTKDINIGIPAEIKLRKKQYEYYRNKLLSFKEVINK